MTTTHPDFVTHEVGIAIDGEPTYVIEVPTAQGREAAERRAIFVVAARHPSMNLDRITTCSPHAEEATMSGNAEHGIEWVRAYPEVAYPLIDEDTRDEALTYIAKFYPYASPPENASEEFFEGAHDEALRVREDAD